MPVHSDERLMLDYAKGQIAAFETLYARYREPLYRYFARHVTDPATANDLYQGCWEKVIAGRRRYRDRAPFRAWLFRIARNHLTDHYRATRPQTGLAESLADDPVRQPEQLHAHEDRLQLFRRALAALPRAQRDTLLLKLEGELTLEQIAKLSGESRETIKSRLRYATAKLKQALQP